MPAWFVALGRLLSGPVVFALCAAFSSVALLPCWYLYVLIEQQASVMWAVLSVPFLYFIWGWGYCALCVVYKWGIFYHPKEGEWPLFSWYVVGWGTTSAITNWANTLFLQHWKGTLLLNFYFRALGVKVGRDVIINTIHIYDWDLVTLEDGAILGGDCVVQGHLLERGAMKMRPVRIGKGALVGTGAKVMPGCTLEERSILAAGSIMKKATTIPFHEVWGGTPPKLIRAHADQGEGQLQQDKD